MCKNYENYRPKKFGVINSNNAYNYNQITVRSSPTLGLSVTNHNYCVLWLSQAPPPQSPESGEGHVADIAPPALIQTVQVEVEPQSDTEE